MLGNQVGDFFFFLSWEDCLPVFFIGLQCHWAQGSVSSKKVWGAGLPEAGLEVGVQVGALEK